MIIKGFKTQLDVNNKQQTLLLQHIGCARWAFNWALNKKKEAFDKKEKIPNAIELHRELNKLNQSGVPWMYQSSKTSPQNALRDCDKAFQNFFTRCKKKVKGKKGFPKFKSKKNEKQSFRLDGAISVESDCIKLPRIGKLKLAKIHYHISNIRKDCLHKITSKIIDENQVIVLEDLKVSNMMKNHCLAQAISDVGLHEFRRQIEYKAKWNGRKVIFADTFFASSKTCSCCGWKNSDLKLTDRIFECKVCDMKIDRDLNASLNLKQIYRESSSRINASGDGSSSNANLVSPSLNEEFNKESRVYILKV